VGHGILSILITLFIGLFAIVVRTLTFVVANQIDLTWSKTWINIAIKIHIAEV
jgi:hypothetical protein